MTDFFHFTLSGFWNFVGVFLLVALAGHIVLKLIVGTIAAIKISVPRNNYQVSIDADDIIKIVRNAMDDGKLDMPFGRAIRRNG